MKNLLLVATLFTLLLGVFFASKPKTRKTTKTPKDEYYIGWWSKTTGVEGMGTRTVDEETAWRIVEDANDKYPDLEHYVVRKETP